MFDESAEIVITREEANAFYDQVCQLRRPDGKTMSQTEIGEHLGVDQNSVSRNQGDRKVGKDVLEEMYKKISDIVVLRRKPNRRQRAWWKAIHRAKLQGVSSRPIAKNPDMSRNTVRKYLAAESPEMIRPVVTPRRYRPAIMADDTKGHNR